MNRAEGLEVASQPLLRCPKKTSVAFTAFSSSFSTAAPTPPRCFAHRARSAELPGTLSASASSPITLTKSVPTAKVIVIRYLYSREQKRNTSLCVPKLGAASRCWQGQKDLNPRHVVLETTALPSELYPYIFTTYLLYHMRIKMSRDFSYFLY